MSRFDAPVAAGPCFGRIFRFFCAHKSDFGQSGPLCVRRAREGPAVSDELLLRLEGHRPSLGHRFGLSREVVSTTSALLFARARGRDTVRARLLLSYWIGRLSALGIAPPIEPR